MPAPAATAGAVSRHRPDPCKAGNFPTPPRVTARSAGFSPGQGAAVRAGRRGSILLLALGLLFCIALYAVGYLNYMQSQRRLRARGTRQHLLSRVARSLATLAVHKIQFGPLLAANSGGSFPERESDSESLFPLFQQLARPRAEMDPVEGEVDLGEVPTSDLETITQDITGPLARMGQFVFHIRYRCQPEDFQEFGLAGAGFRREKKGRIRLLVRLELQKPGGQALSEEFSYVCPVKVVAPLTPVLSKFTLYVENAGFPESTTTYEYNRVRVDENGALMPDSPAAPLILDNDGPGSPNGPLTVETTMDRFVEAPRGLVYLGGPTELRLNLAYSPATGLDATHGEGFQLFRKSGGDGFWWCGYAPLPGGGDLRFYQMEIGCSPSSHDNVRLFYDLIRQEASTRFWPLFRDSYHMQESSVFRLNGVDANRSPTLVLGNVAAHVLMARLYQSERLRGPPWNQVRARERLFLYEDPLKFQMESTIPNGKLALLREAGLISGTADSLGEYIMRHSSFIGPRQVNLAVPFAHNRTVPDPWTAFPDSDPLIRFCKGDATDEEKHAVPEAFRGLPGVTSLREMAPFLAPIRDQSRYAYVLTIPAGPDVDLWTALQRRGLLWNGVLSLDGLILVRSPSGRLVLDRPLSYLGNGGIHLEEGELVIGASIRPLAGQRPHAILQLAALHGDIRLTGPDGTEIQAGLVANGRLRFEGGRATALAGSLAMKALAATPADLAAFPGAALTYYPPLAARPALPGRPAPAEAASEQPALSFNFELVPTEEN
ncbi:MAG: hypothetical protein GX442_17985 [Candidatus Riflebacteria bacterium]|nr:hypothetical protein [Candidatus Riflebacteria bacterium]